jgi:endonuclease YncB( thermonuclease family)
MRLKTIALICLGLTVPLSALSAQIFSGEVVAVADGDTITVLDDSRRQIKVRLAGIDAPEKMQPYGQKSKATLSVAAFGKKVNVIGSKVDRYKRLIAKVVVPSDATCTNVLCPGSIDVGLRQVELGMAWWYRKYAIEQTPFDQAAYEVAEDAAKRGRSGLWRDADPVAPWEWRKLKR